MRKAKTLLKKNNYRQTKKYYIILSALREVMQRKGREKMCFIVFILYFFTQGFSV